MKSYRDVLPPDAEFDPGDFGDRLRDARNDAGYTLQRFADKMNVSKSTASRWESGENQPDYKTLVKIALLLGTNLESLIIGEDRKYIDATVKYGLKSDGLHAMTVLKDYKLHWLMSDLTASPIDALNALITHEKCKDLLELILNLLNARIQQEAVMGLVDMKADENDLSELRDAINRLHIDHPITQRYQVILSTPEREIKTILYEISKMVDHMIPEVVDSMFAKYMEKCSDSLSKDTSSDMTHTQGG